MGQQKLFEPVAGRLGRPLHVEVFGHLPAQTARLLDVEAVGRAVRALLAAGWRPAQVAARVGALPSAEDPVPGVTALCEQLLARRSPRATWEAERSVREQVAAAVPQRAVATEAVREHWIGEARRTLGLPARAPARPAPPPKPTCASCAGDGSFFVARGVRLCADCVGLLRSGHVRLAAG